MAVNLFTGATDNNWGTATNWSLGTVPTAADGHDTTFDVTSPNCTVNTSARVCNRLTFVGYTNTITMTNAITVSGNITLGAGMNIAGASGLTVNAAATLTSNGKTWPNAFTTSGTSLTWTFADNWTFGGLLSASGSTLATYNGSAILCTNGFQHNIPVGGTTTATITGGTLGGSSTGAIRLNLTINPGAANVTIGSTFRFNGNTLTYTAGVGTVITTGSLFTTNTSTVATTLNVNGIAWNNVQLALNPGTVTLTSDIQVNGTLTIGDAGSATGVNGSSMYAYGSVNVATSSGVSVTAVLVIAGSGTFTSSGTIAMPMTINTTGTFTINTLNTGATTITYVNGTVTGTKQIRANGSLTLNTDGMSWGLLDLTPNDIAGKTVTLTSRLTVDSIRVGGLTNSAITNNFAGTHGFVCADLVITPVNSRTVTFVGGVNYIVTNLLILANNTTGLSISATGTGRARFIIHPNAVVAIWAVTITNIDNASGYPINVFIGSTTTSANWRVVTRNIPKPTNVTIGLNSGSAGGLY
jgi:hypothetical protein